MGDRFAPYSQANPHKPACVVGPSLGDFCNNPRGNWKPLKGSCVIGLKAFCALSLYYRKFRAAYLVYTFTPVLKAMSLWLELMGVTEKKASSISTLIWQANLNS